MIIGFAGKAGVGKDTAGNYLKLKQWKHHSFALPLKRTVAKFLGLPLSAMENRELKDGKLDKPIKLTSEDADRLMSIIPHPILGHKMAEGVRTAVEGKEIYSIRELLQFVGTDVGRDLINVNIWTNIASEELKNLSKSQNVVLTDVRFENEKNAIAELGGATIEIKRDTELSDVNPHASENIDFDCDLSIDNNESRQALYEKIENFLKEKL